MSQRMSFLGKNNSSFGTRRNSFNFYRKRGSKLIAKVVEPDDYWFIRRVRVRRA